MLLDSGYGIGDRVADVLSRSEFDAALVEVDLSRNRLSGRGTKLLLERLPRHSLRKLDLSHNRVGRQGARGLSRLLWVRSRVLCVGSTFCLSVWCCDSWVWWAQCACGLVKDRMCWHCWGQFCSRPTYHFIGVVWCGVVWCGVVLLQTAPRLKTLLLEQAELDDAALVAVMDGVAHATALSTLVLSGNSMKDAGAQALARVLDPSSGIPLRRLDVSWNNIAGAGAAAIVGAMQTNTSVVVRTPLPMRVWIHRGSACMGIVAPACAKS